ncbi:MAG TPA: TetR/AcrR family transcriptional regulator [Sediminispirochaeta sp.]|nr:TetR/AcrR family transcriptional regulator [Sediminispirochaeta sp.]
MSPKKVDTLRKRRELAAAALRVFIKKSYRETRIQDIADEAGVGKGTIYEYFRDKAEILHEIFEQEFQQLLVEDHEELPPLQALLANIRRSFASAKPQRELTQLWFEVWSSKVIDPEHPINAKMRKLFDDLAVLYRRYIEQGQSKGEIRTGLDADSTARMIVSALDGIILHVILFNLSSEEAERRCEAFIGMARATLRE